MSSPTRPRPSGRRAPGAPAPPGRPARRALTADPIAEARRQWSAHGWGPGSAGMAAVTSVMRAQQIYLARVDDTLRPFGLTFSRYELLMLLLFSRAGALPLGRIGTRLQVHPASVTNAVDRLEAGGLLERVPHQTDRRTTLARILPAGRSLALEATAALNRQVFEVPGLSADDAGHLFEILGRLRAGSGDYAPDGPADGLTGGPPR